MNNGPLLFFGLLAALATSFWGLLMASNSQIGSQQPVVVEATGEFYPPARPGLAQEGAQVYVALGCAECHSQQVRGLGADLQRPGWGKRITVAQDYLRDYPVQLGSQRIGPDLANYGSRQTNAAIILAHLYDPQKAMPGSMMPPYRFLFDTRKLVESEPLPAGALAPSPVAGYAVVPKGDAETLAAYLMSLKSDVPLFEAPVPAPATNVPSASAGSTNTAPTNAPATAK